jgi:thiamine monophosphate synthase
MKGYYFITDASLSRAGNLHDVTQAVAAGVRAVQYREKRADLKHLMEEARKLRKSAGT